MNLNLNSLACPVCRQPLTTRTPYIRTTRVAICRACDLMITVRAYTEWKEKIMEAKRKRLEYLRGGNHWEIGKSNPPFVFYEKVKKFNPSER